MVAIEGGAAAGKSTLAARLEQIFDCNVWHLDDFYLRPEQRTAERLSEVGGNVDYERFYEEVITKVKEHQTVQSQKFDCSVMALDQRFVVPYKRLNIMEGSYSAHPYFKDVYDLKIYIDVDAEEQERRIRARNTAPSR